MIPLENIERICFSTVRGRGTLNWRLTLLLHLSGLHLLHLLRLRLQLRIWDLMLKLLLLPILRRLHLLLHLTSLTLLLLLGSRLLLHLWLLTILRLLLHLSILGLLLQLWLLAVLGLLTHELLLLLLLVRRLLLIWCLELRRSRWH